MRYFLIDKIIDYSHGEHATALKAITLTDPVLHDHFPDFPIMPGALILEGVAQLAGFLLETTFNTEDAEIIKRGIFVQADKFKVMAPTGPGEVLRYECKIISTLEDAGKVSFEVKCHITDEVRAKGNVTFKLGDINTENISKQRLGIYTIWTRGLENCPVLR